MFDRFIEYAARVAPDKVAMRSFGGGISFSRMDAEINKLAKALSETFPSHIKTVAISYQQVHPHWMFLMALSRLGLASASVSDDASVAVKEIAILQPDAIISDSLFDVDTSAQVFVLDVQWYSTVVGGPNVNPIRLSLDYKRIVRIAISAGTSEERHRVDFDAAMIESAVLRMTEQECSGWVGSEQAAVYPSLLPTLGFGSVHGFLCHLSIWAVCGSIILADREQYPAAIMMLKPSLMIISPIQLQAIMDHMPVDVPPVKDLRLIVSAGHFPHQLREAVKQRLTEHMRLLYVTSEAGIIAGAHISQVEHDDMAGWLMPWLDLQIVNEHDELLPFGEMGRVRIRAPELVQGFYQNEEATKKQFRDGWFYPGDLGILDQTGFLRICGRIDDLYNFGGDKFYAHQIDLALRAVPGVSDAALFSLPNQHGIAEPWIAIVKGDDFDPVKVDAVLSRDFRSLPNARAMWVEYIPRDETDRVLRYQLSMVASQHYANLSS